MKIDNWDDFLEYVPEDIVAADIEHYLLCEYWTLHEAGYLLNNINDEQGYPRKGSPMVKTQILLEKAAKAGLLGEPVGDGFLPYRIISYAIDKGSKVPDALKSFYEKAMQSEIEAIKSDPQNEMARNWLDAEKPDQDNTNVFFQGYGDWWICDGHPDDESAFFHISDGGYRASGVFTLSKTDKKAYGYTKRLDGVGILFPCNHPDDEFSRMARIGALYIKEMEYRIDSKDAKSCYFRVSDKKPIIKIIEELDSSPDAETLENNGADNQKNETTKQYVKYKNSLDAMVKESGINLKALTVGAIFKQVKQTNIDLWSITFATFKRDVWPDYSKKNGLEKRPGRPPALKNRKI